MFLSSWLNEFTERIHKNRRVSRRRPRVSEKLENRTLLTVTGVLVGTELTVFSDAGEDLVVQRSPINGIVDVVADGQSATTVPQIDSTLLTRLEIVTSDENDSVDLRAVTASDFGGLIGQAEPIVVSTADGNDMIIGSDDFNEWFDGGHGQDTLIGNAGLDTLDGGHGNDSIVGGDGVDSLIGDDGEDTIEAGLGNDVIDAGDGNDSVMGEDGNDVIEAGDGDDTVDGGAGTDMIVGFSGNDVINGGTDNDTIFGGADADIVSGGDGDDMLIGNGGRDTMMGDDGVDHIEGGKGGDSLDGGQGNDVIIGNSGNDKIAGNSGNDSLFGGAGRDNVSGDVGDDMINGNGGADTLSGTAGFDRVDGGAGDDLVLSGSSSGEVILDISNATVLEGSTGSTIANFTVTLSSPASDVVTVEFSTSDSSAVAPMDYASTNGIVTFQPGVTSQGIDITVVADTVDEFNETFNVVLANASGAIINDGLGVGTIIDDDTVTTSSVQMTVTPFSGAADAAFSFLQANAADFGLTTADVSNFVVTDEYSSSHNGVTHLYVQQTYQDIPIVDATINVNIGPGGDILSVNSSFVGDVISLGLSATPDMTADEAFTSLQSSLPEFLEENDPHGDLGNDELGFDIDYSDVKFNRFEGIGDRLQWVQAGDGLELSWTINVQTTDGLGWHDTSVDADTGEIVHNGSWTSHASYNALPVNIESPLYGQRNIEVDPQDLVASPFGWHDTDGVAGAEFTDTQGNNVDAFLDRDFDFAGTRPDGGATLDFDFPFDQTQAASAWSDAAVVNLFYANNAIHDIHYHYGFDEASGNFQENNYGNGGVGGDAVQALAQAGADLGFANNAFMATPPDGFSPTMAMFEFNITNPTRDSDLDNGIIIHEYGHGVTNRLTGGPANANALSSIQSRGMGEGWSDWWALMFSQTATDMAEDARGIGNWVLGLPQTGGGIRRLPYSFDMSINSHTYGSFNGGFPNNQFHNAGEIWASALWDMNWLLINGVDTPDCLGHTVPGYGFDPDLYNGSGGNNIALQLVMDGLKLQATNPSFLDARDGILLADQINNGGANQRAIWTAFARRGMGFSADDGGGGFSTVVTEAFDLPPETAGISFDMVNYQLGAAVEITVCDPDAAATMTTVDVDVMTSDGDLETVTLVRQADNISFVGTIDLQASVAQQSNGFLDVNSEAALLTGTYTDLNSGPGIPFSGSFPNQFSGGAVNSALGDITLPISPGVQVTIQSFATVTNPQGDTLIGGDGNDTLIAAEGDDSLEGNAGDDTLTGASGDDILLGGENDDTLDGGSGDDILQGGGGANVIVGGAGTNTILWDSTEGGVDVVDGFVGADQLLAFGSDTAAESFVVDSNSGFLRIAEGSGSITASNQVSQVTLLAGEGDDTITVQSIADVRLTNVVLDGGLGNDTITATGAAVGGNRLNMIGGEGDDTISGSLGRDSVDGGEGDDSLSGGDGDDFVDGGIGNDQIAGDGGNDTVNGNLGNDVITGGDGDDSLLGSFGKDQITGGNGDDVVNGGFGVDNLTGSGGNDLLEGGEGDDRMFGGSGDDSVDGGSGNDYIRGHSGSDQIKGGDGEDTIVADGGNDTIDAGDGDDTITGGNGNDIIDAGDGNDTIVGGEGNDTLIAGDGHDTVFGGAGKDWLFGGDGNDFLKGNGSTDKFNSGEGDDTLAGLTGNEFDNTSLRIGTAVRKALAKLNGF